MSETEYAKLLTEQRQAAKRTVNTFWPEPLEDDPSFEKLTEMEFNGVARATDGCTVETDGVCPHGYPSWLIHLGII